MILPRFHPGARSHLNTPPGRRAEEHNVGGVSNVGSLGFGAWGGKLRSPTTVSVYHSTNSLSTESTPRLSFLSCATPDPTPSITANITRHPKFEFSRFTDGGKASQLD